MTRDHNDQISCGGGFWEQQPLDIATRFHIIIVRFNMSYTKITQDEFTKLTMNLIGLPVSLAWKGIGSAIFLELGNYLLPSEYQRLLMLHQSGQSGISVMWDWHIEDKSHIIFGSSNSEAEIDSQISMLEDTSVAKIALVGNIPEIEVSFSNGLILRSMIMNNYGPQWTIKICEDKYTYIIRNNIIVTSDSTDDTESDEEPEEESDYSSMDLEEEISQRWGKPEISPVKGNCRFCEWYIKIDGEHSLIDYGVCTNSESDLDGKVVNCSGGCPAFVQEET